VDVSRTADGPFDEFQVASEGHRKPEGPHERHWRLRRYCVMGLICDYWRDRLYQDAKLVTAMELQVASQIWCNSGLGVGSWLMILGGGCDGVGVVGGGGVLLGGGPVELVADVGEVAGDRGRVAQSAPAR